jgi:hypothetical protein
MVAHFKHGASSSLVWVTSLDQGKPVAGSRSAYALRRQLLRSA